MCCNVSVVKEEITVGDVAKPKDHLQGMTLEAILHALVEHFGWFDLGCIIRINCFNDDPSIKSSLKFLRKTPWARTKVEALYVSMMNSIQDADHTDHTDHTEGMISLPVNSIAANNSSSGIPPISNIRI